MATMLASDRVEQRERIRRLRLLRRWDQAELGRHAGYSVGTISQIETGRLIPTDDQVAKIAGALGYSREFLDLEMSMAPTTRPWLRAYADASKKEADARVAACITAVEHIRQIGLKPLPDQIPVFTGDADNDDELEEAAVELRAFADVEQDAVIGNVIRAAERLGCVVLPFESELGRHFGLSVRSDNVPIICVAYDENIPGDRQRFTVAHELGHLMLHGAARPPGDNAEAARMESQANRFAAAFLGPADPLIESLNEFGGRVTLNALSNIKGVWGVSIKSLVGRFRDLGMITNDHARSLYKQISARGWNTAEPVEVHPERAQWFSRSLIRRAGIAGVAPAATKLAREVGANPADLLSFASWEPRPTADVVPLDSRRSRSARYQDAAVRHERTPAGR